MKCCIVIEHIATLEGEDPLYCVFMSLDGERFESTERENYFGSFGDAKEYAGNLAGLLRLRIEERVE